MSQFQKLLHEIHRRSLWQVLGLYLGASWVILQVVDTFIQQGMGPEWAFQGAIFVLLLGLPIVLATAFIQEGAESAPESEEAGAESSTGSEDAEGKRPDEGDDLPATRRLFTWRNAAIAGVGAFALLGLASAGYMAMRSLGIGPVGTLIARGQLDERSELVLADFVSPADPELGRAVEFLLRRDLSQSPQLELVSDQRIAEILGRMGRDPHEPLDEATAREVAIRGGHEAVLAGEIASAGSGYVLSAELIAAQSGEALARFAEPAADSTRLTEAAGELSRDVRERVGESLASVRSSPFLPSVTTASLEALRHFSRGLSVAREGDLEAAILHVEAAIEADTGFAYAHRVLGIMLESSGRDRARRLELLERAYRSRDRLTEAERLDVSALYQDIVAGRPDSAIAVYKRWIALQPEQWHGRYNNLAVMLRLRGDFAESEAYMERLEAQAATEGDTMADLHFNTLARAQYLQGEDAELRSTLDRWRSLYPESRERDGWLFGWAAADARYADADSLLEAYVERHAEPGETRIEALRWRGYLEAARGRLGSARRFLGSARESLLRERGAEFEGLRVAAEMARLEMIAGDTSAALAGVRSALVETPLAGLEPPDRPYLDLARLYADAGDPRAATELLEEYRAETDSARAAFRSMPLLARASVAIAESHPGEALVLIDERPPFGGEERALQPLLRGRALAAMGRTADAIAAYEEYVGPRNEEKYRLNAFHLAEVLERLGALYDERGEPERAAEYYARFVELWEDAGPELQPRVEVARSRLEPLVAERGERSTPTGGRR